MPRLDQVPEEYDNAHVLIVGDSKAGKSTYLAQAVLDGFKVILVDSDNGLSALRYALKIARREHLMSNVMYYRTNSPADFILDMFQSSIFRWNMTQDRKFMAMEAKPTDRIVEMIPARFPRGLVLGVDSWSAVALDAMEISAENKKTTLEDMLGTGDMQGVYGGASMKLTLLLAILQHVKFHAIVIAHGTMYEIYEKPANSVNAKQKEMKLIDSYKVPLSSSKPHGYAMGKYFTDIGWAEINNRNERTLDYQAQYKRVGGGRPNTAGPIGEMSFRKTFAEPMDFEWSDSFIREYTYEEMKTAAPPAKPLAPVLPNQAANTGVTVPTPSLPKTPVNPVLAAMQAAKAKQQ